MQGFPLATHSFYETWILVHSYAQDLKRQEYSETTARRTTARLAVWITYPVTSSTDTVPRNTYGDNTGCFFFPFLSTNSLVKQITNLCNGCAFHHLLSQVRSHYNFHRKMQKYSNFKQWSSTFQWNHHFLHPFCFISSIPTDESFLRIKTRSIYQCQSIQELSSRKNAFNVHLLQRCAFCS